MIFIAICKIKKDVTIYFAISVRLMDWRDFYPLNLIYNTMDYLEKQYPSVCTVTSIGQSVEGRDIKVRYFLQIKLNCSVIRENIYREEIQKKNK